MFFCFGFPILEHIYCFVNNLFQHVIFIDHIIDDVIINVLIIDTITEAQTTHRSSNQLQREDYWVSCDAVILKHRNNGKLEWFLHFTSRVDIKLGRAMQQLSEPI